MPCLTVLCPSERFYEQQGRRHQTLTERAWPMISLVRRGLPDWAVVFVTESRFVALDLLDQLKTVARASLLTRLRREAALYAPAPPRKPDQKGRP